MLQTIFWYSVAQKSSQNSVNMSIIKSNMQNLENFKLKEIAHHT